MVHVQSEHGESRYPLPEVPQEEAISSFVVDNLLHTKIKRPLCPREKLIVKMG